MAAERTCGLSPGQPASPTCTSAPPRASAQTERQRILGELAHELRTPLTAIRASVELLLDGRVERARQRQLLQMIHDQAAHLAHLADNLLEAARQNSGHVRWTWSTVPLHKVCCQALAVVQPLARQHRLTVQGRVEPKDLVVQGDADALLRLMLNLLANACQATRHGGVRLSIRPADGLPGRWVRMTVSDTGPGIPADRLARLGQAFALNNGVVTCGQWSGSGLGLAICRTLAAIHGGRIAIDSQPGLGTTVTVWLRADLDGPSNQEPAPLLINPEEWP